MPQLAMYTIVFGALINAVAVIGFLAIPKSM
jgi:hypothetical protein